MAQREYDHWQALTLKTDASPAVRAKAAQNGPRFMGGLDIRSFQRNTVTIWMQ